MILPQRPHRTRPVSRALPPRGLPRGPLLHVCILSQHLPVLLELFPTDVALMVILDRHIPGMHRLPMPDRLSRPTIHDLNPVCPASERICASIDGILHHLNKIVIGRRLPYELLMLGILTNHRDFDARISSPEEQLTRTPQFPELAEHQLDGLADTLIGIDLDLINIVPAVARRKREAQLSAFGFGVPCRKSPLPQ